jgi:CheY-like chemotaxis protein
MTKNHILMCADFEVPIDPTTHRCTLCTDEKGVPLAHDMQSTYLWDADKPIPERKKRILIVDDDPCVRRELARTFKLRGLNVYQASDGHMGVEQWRESYPIDYLVTDYQMPRKNGVALCVEIRKLLKGLPVQTKIVLISADPPKMPKEIADIPVLKKLYFSPADLLEKLGIIEA